MQSIYSVLKSQNDDIVQEEKFLKVSIKKMYDLYVLLLQLIVEVQKLAEQKQAISKKKHLATKEDLSPNRKFVDNRLIHKISKSSSLSIYIDNHQLNNWSVDDKYVKIIWDRLQKSDLYSDYLNSLTNSYQEDQTFVIDFFREIIAPDAKLADYFEGENISWVDDIPFVNTWIVKSLHKMNAQSIFSLDRLYKNEDDENFVSELFKKVILNHHTFENDIKIHTPNWESDRIADVDMILIKMGMGEFLYFSSIPVRVSINEYIEIAKDYSTQKSGYFVNGVLDKLSKELTKDKRFVKLGRGLL